MLTNRELRIIDLFRENIFASFTIMEIMKKIGTKSYSWVHNAVKKIQKENLLSLEKKGQNQICTINLDEQKTLVYLSLLEGISASGKNIPNLDEVIKLMPAQFHILIISGSYASGTFTKKSDIDVVVIIDEKENRQFLLNKLLRKGELMMPELHPYVFTRKEFLEMLINKEENYGKEIEKKHLIISGTELYFKILKEAIENGYRR